MRTLSITRKDLLILLKDRGTLLFTFLLPVVFVLAFSLADIAGSGSGQEGIALAVVNGDSGSAGQRLIDGLAGGGLRIEPWQTEDAQRAFADGDLARYLLIPPDLSQVGLEHSTSLRLVTHPDANAETTQAVLAVIQGVAADMELELQLVATFEQMGDMLQAAPAEYQVFTADVTIAQAESQWERSASSPLIAVEETVPQGSGEKIDLNSTQLRVPGFTVLFVFLTAQSVAASLFTEKRQGTFRRLLAAPVRRSSLLMGKMLPNFAVGLAQIAVIFAVGRWILPLLGLEPLSLGHDPLGLIVTSAVVALCSTGVGIFIAGLARTEMQVGGLSSVLLWVMGALGGSFYPTFLMSGFLRTASQLVPHSWALRAYNGLLVEGGTLVDILPELGVLAGFSVVFFAIGLWRFDFE